MTALTDRRRFLAIFSAVGLSSTLLPGGSREDACQDATGFHLEPPTV